MKHKSQLWAIVLPVLVLAIGGGVATADSSHPSDPAQAPAVAAAHSPGPAQSATPGAATPRPAPVWQGTQINRLSRRADMFYESAWGVGELRVKAAESGQIIRFDYRVLDPAKATVLNDKKIEPKLIDPKARVVLVVPQLEKVGALRQSSTPKAGMTYWMGFSNPTLAVKRGDRVDVVIGSFRATSILVE